MMRPLTIALAAISLHAQARLVLAQATPSASVSATLTLRGLDGRERAVSRADFARLTRYDTTVTVEASDGYRVLFSIAEIDAGFTDRVIIVADAKDGRPLPAGDGPYRIIVPGEKRPARWARQVVRISLGRAP